jgi:hypothetical protein
VSEAIAICSFDDFLDAEQSADRRHELVGGRVYMMAGGSERPDLMAGFIYERIEAARPAQGRITAWTVYAPGDVVVTGFGDIDVDALYDIGDRTATTT